jgi:hypothetical protein
LLSSPSTTSCRRRQDAVNVWNAVDSQLPCPPSPPVVPLSPTSSRRRRPKSSCSSAVHLSPRSCLVV